MEKHEALGFKHLVGTIDQVREMMKKTTKVQLKHIRELLKSSQARDAGGLFVAEGLKIVRDIAAKGHEINAVFVSRVFAEDPDNRSILLHFEKRPVPVYCMGVSEFEKVSSLRHPGGILALVEKNVPSRHVPLDADHAFIVLCDGIQDPGNLGAIVRSSVAFGVDHLILTGETVDVYNPRVVRSSSGMVLDIPVTACSYRELDQLKKKGYRIFASQAMGGKDTDIGKLKQLPPLCIVAFGSEGQGISEEVCNRADGFFHIPVSGRVESLNVTAAAAVSLYEFNKRRKADG